MLYPIRVFRNRLRDDQPIGNAQAQAGNKLTTAKPTNSNYLHKPTGRTFFQPIGRDMPPGDTLGQVMKGRKDELKTVYSHRYNDFDVIL